MAVLRPYITAGDLRVALSVPTYLALLDDAQSGVVATVDASAEVALVMSRAHAMVASRLPAIYFTIPDTAVSSEVPMLLKHAELYYACALSYDRHPEYQRTYGSPRYASEANLIMDQVQSSILRIADNPPDPTPTNVGGATVSGAPRVFFDASGNYTGGDY